MKDANSENVGYSSALNSVTFTFSIPSLHRPFLIYSRNSKSANRLTSSSVTSVFRYL